MDMHTGESCTLASQKVGYSVHLHTNRGGNKFTACTVTLMLSIHQVAARDIDSQVRA